jgi:hypothetical protein
MTEALQFLPEALTLPVSHLQNEGSDLISLRSADARASG